jgi:Response regulator containing a CheY-like receiver domain and an HTH DNA-binding domain
MNEKMLVRTALKNISVDHSLSELILQHPFLMPVLYMLGIQGSFDGKTIGQICKDKSINESFLLDLLKVYTCNKFILEETLPSYSILQLSDLLSAIYPYLLDQFDTLISDMQTKLKKSIFKNEESRTEDNILNLRCFLDEYRQLISDRFLEHMRTVLPHIKAVYELYYCPDYTSERSNILNYSLEFYNANGKNIEKVFDKIKQLLEQSLETKSGELRYFKNIYAFYQLNEDVLVQDRMEQLLLKPLVMQMEESIINTFYEKNKIFRRNTYLPLPKGTLLPDILSPREKEVLQLVAQGFINKEIAERLQIGLTTVITHRKNIVNKLGIKTIPGLTVYAYTHGYLDKPTPMNED